MFADTHGMATAICWLHQEQERSPENKTDKQTQNSTQKIVQLVQRQYFPDEIESSSGGRQINNSSKFVSISPVLIEGTLRVGGRIRHAPIPFDATNPMLLPKDHPISTLIVRYYQETLRHAGREHVLSALRQRFGIFQARSLVRQVLRNSIKRESL